VLSGAAEVVSLEVLGELEEAAAAAEAVDAGVAADQSPFSWWDDQCGE
jgi:hypothetical protein